MRHCGHEQCLGNACENWPKCKGETIPPWNFDQHQHTTAEVSIREQDIFAAADILAEAALDAAAAGCVAEGACDLIDCKDCKWYKLTGIALDYKRERNGK